MQPWRRFAQQWGTASAFAVLGKHILTSAFHVRYTSLITLKKASSDHRFTATVVAVAEEYDLAVLDVEDPSFWTDIIPLQLGTVPALQQKVKVLGFKKNAETVSVTNGTVSRVQMYNFTESAGGRLTVFLDTMLDAENHGGPALNEEHVVIGAVTEPCEEGTSNGSLVAVETIQRFLEDLDENSSFDGVCHCGFLWQKTENSSLRRFLHMRDDHVGILILDVPCCSPARDILRAGDVVLAMDDVVISSKGTVQYRDQEKVTFSYVVSMRSVGQRVKVDILRDGEYISVEYNLGSHIDFYRVSTQRFVSRPEYFIIGGLVFVVLSEQYLLNAFGMNWSSQAPVLLRDEYLHGTKNDTVEQVVVLSQILNSEITVAYELIEACRVSKFNRETIHSLAHLAQMVTACQEESLAFEMEEDDYVIVLDRKNALARSEEILKAHGVPKSENTTTSMVAL